MAAVRLATRGSAQARRQAELVAASLAATGVETELVIVETTGDRTQADDVPLHTIGGQGVFVKEVQRAVLDGDADVAVHSAKDLPTITEPGLTIGAFTERRSPADALIGRALVDLPTGAIVATGSVRRRAQLGRARPDIEFQELRGNIGTRLEKIPVGGSIVMAVAALEVLELTDHVAEVLDTAEFVPAVGQGCVALECRAADHRTRELIGHVDHAPTRSEVVVERAFLGELGSGCSLPVGAHAHGARLYTFLSGETNRMAVSETIELSGDLEADIVAARSAARQAHLHVAGG